MYLHPDDANIDREYKPGESAVLYDADGEHRFTFPASWTDEQILIAVRFANQSYQNGFEDGKSNKAYEIRAALGLENKP